MVVTTTLCGALVHNGQMHSTAGRRKLDVPLEVHMSAPIRGEATLLVLRAMGKAEGPVRYKVLRESTELSNASISRALGALEEAGLVSADLPAGERRGYGVMWTLHRDKLDEAFTRLYNFATGAGDDAGPNAFPLSK